MERPFRRRLGGLPQEVCTREGESDEQDDSEPYHPRGRYLPIEGPWRQGAGGTLYDRPVRRLLADDFVLDDDRERVDRSAAHRYLAGESYWATGRDREINDELIETAARVVGLYAPDLRMVGYSRTVSDLHTVAYVADVYVLEEARGRGLGLELVRFTVDEAPFAITKWLLHTRDMHTLYERVGFVRPGLLAMERGLPDLE
jgi:GNAT superfamily N-acetyltransferase